MSATLEMRVGGKTFAGPAIPQAFLDLGNSGIRAYSYAVGKEAADTQVAKGNEIAGIFVDGYRNRPIEQMKRDIVWEFSIGNSQLVKAVREALELCRQLSNEYGAKSSGAMSNSWSVYINGKPAQPDELEKVVPGKDDVRVTSSKEYARFLEAGYWTGSTKVLKRESTRGMRALSRGKVFRKNIAVTDEVANRLRRKYKSVNIADVWYDTSPFSHTRAAPNMRWPAIVFNKRKRAL